MRTFLSVNKELKRWLYNEILERMIPEGVCLVNILPFHGLSLEVGREENPSFSLPWRKMTFMCEKPWGNKDDKPVFGSSLSSDFLLINRGTKCFPNDRMVRLFVMLKSVSNRRNLAKLCLSGH